MEDNKTLEMEEMTNTEVMDTCEPDEESGKGFGTVGVGIALAAAGVGIAVVCKKIGKLDEWRIRRLEKKGYTVLKSTEEVIDAEVVDSDEEPEEK